MSGLHAGHSLGVLAGGVAGAALAAAGVGTGAHFAAAAALAMLAAFAATAAVLDEPRAPGPVLALPRGRLLALGLVAFCAFLTEGAANDWSAVHLRHAHGATAGTAALAFVAFTLALSAARVAGDRVVARTGRARAVQGGAALAAAGIALALAAPGIPSALAGWALLGAGVAVMAPTVLGAASTLHDAVAPRPPTPAPVAIAAVTTVGYLGAFSGPPLIGGIAELTGLTAALALVGVAALGAGALAQRAL
jgi:MFS family permease